MVDEEDYKTRHYAVLADLSAAKKLVGQQADTIKKLSETLASQSATIDVQTKIIEKNLEELITDCRNNKKVVEKKQKMEKEKTKVAFDVYDIKHVIARAPRHPEFEQYVASGKMKEERKRDGKDGRIVLIGRPEKDDETSETLTAELKNILEENGTPAANIKESFRFPHKRDRTRNGYRPIKIVLRDVDHKTEVKAMLGRKAGHFAGDDQTYLERERDKQLRRYVLSVKEELRGKIECGGIRGNHRL